jgi:hypothetical protein
VLALKQKRNFRQPLVGRPSGQSGERVADKEVKF